MESVIEINHYRIPVKNLEKVFWPDEGYTKGDLMSYYSMYLKQILPDI